jgi:type I restriction enzyme M protein
VLTGELRNQIDRIWDAFWSGGIANPLEEMETMEERKAQRTGEAMARPKPST